MIAAMILTVLLVTSSEPEIETNINTHCSAEWKDDRSMRDQCVQQQRVEAARFMSEWRQLEPGSVSWRIYDECLRYSVSTDRPDYGMANRCAEWQVDLEAKRKLRAIKLKGNE